LSNSCQMAGMTNTLRIDDRQRCQIESAVRDTLTLLR